MDSNSSCFIPEDGLQPILDAIDKRENRIEVLDIFGQRNIILIRSVSDFQLSTTEGRNQTVGHNAMVSAEKRDYRNKHGLFDDED